MEYLDLLNFRRSIIENNIILLFEGKMSQGVLVALVDMLKEKLNAAEQGEEQMPYFARKLYAVFVELAQNIQNHSIEKEIAGNHGVGSGIIVLRENVDYFTITSGNAMLADAADALQQYCAYLNSLDGDTLKKLYKEKLRAARRENEKGAGIGLIEIMRKSESILETAVQAVDDRTVFFTLSVNIAKGDLNG